MLYESKQIEKMVKKSIVEEDTSTTRSFNGSLMHGQQTEPLNKTMCWNTSVCTIWLAFFTRCYCFPKLLEYVKHELEPWWLKCIEIFFLYYNFCEGPGKGLHRPRQCLRILKDELFLHLLVALMFNLFKKWITAIINSRLLITFCFLLPNKPRILHYLLKCCWSSLLFVNIKVRFYLNLLQVLGTTVNTSF